MIAFDSKSPVNSDRFSQVFAVLRSIKQQYKERFTLDHYMDDELNTSLPNADGFHRQITLSEYNEYDNMGITLSKDPTFVNNDSGILYMKVISGQTKLVFKNETTTAVIR